MLKFLGGMGWRSRDGGGGRGETATHSGSKGAGMMALARDKPSRADASVLERDEGAGDGGHKCPPTERKRRKVLSRQNRDTH